MNEYVIRRVREHYEVYKNGKFQFSADTLQEAQYEVENESKNN